MIWVTVHLQRSEMRALFCLPILLLARGALSDTPANCTFEDVEGSWIFYESERSQGNNIDCSKNGISFNRYNLSSHSITEAVVNKLRVDLKYPNVVVDQFGSEGTWTMVYNQVFDDD